MLRLPTIPADTPPAAPSLHKGWPPRLPSTDEADAIAATRARLLARHGLANHYPNGTAIITRFAELIERREGAA